MDVIREQEKAPVNERTHVSARDSLGLLLGDYLQHIAPALQQRARMPHLPHRLAALGLVDW